MNIAGSNNNLARRQLLPVLLSILLLSVPPVFALEPWMRFTMSTGDLAPAPVNATSSLNVTGAPQIALSTVNFRAAVISAVSVPEERFKLLGWTVNTTHVVALFAFRALSAEDQNKTDAKTSVALAVKLQYILLLEDTVEYWTYLYPLHILESEFDPLLPAATYAPETTEAPSGTSGPPVPPTPLPYGHTPVPTPLAPRATINGSGLLFTDLEGDSTKTSYIYIGIFVTIGVFMAAGLAVALIKCCGREKKEKKQDYGRVVH